MDEVYKRLMSGDYTGPEWQEYRRKRIAARVRKAALLGVLKGLSGDQLSAEIDTVRTRLEVHDSVAQKIQVSADWWELVQPIVERVSTKEH